MATAKDLLDDLRDRLEDDLDQKSTREKKLRYINRGLSACYPRIYENLIETRTIAAGTFEADVSDDILAAIVYRVEQKPSTGDYPYRMIEDWITVPGSGIKLPEPPGAEMSLRVWSYRSMPPLVADEDLYVGPLGSEELPVLYAMGLFCSKGLDKRLTYQRYSTTQAQNGVSENDLLAAAQFYFQQFDELLERFALPLPGVSGVG